jgi:predicted DNA-binding transcriptional regulator
MLYNFAKIEGMIEEKLKQLGLSEKEALIYLCILENTRITPSAIARKTKISRPTVYSVGKELVSKGYITEDIASAGMYFVAQPPEQILRDIEKRKADINDQFKIAQSLISDLDSLPRSQKYSIPRVRFIDDIRFDDFIYSEAPIWDKSALERDATWWGFQDSALLKNYPEWLEWYWKQVDPRIENKMITNAEDNNLSFKGKDDVRRQMKIWNKGKEIGVTQAVIGDYVILANTNQKPHYLVEIHDAVMAESLRQVFKGIWETL